MVSTDIFLLQQKISDLEKENKEIKDMYISLNKHTKVLLDRHDVNVYERSRIVTSINLLDRKIKDMEIIIDGFLKQFSDLWSDQHYLKSRDDTLYKSIQSLKECKIQTKKEYTPPIRYPKLKVDNLDIETTITTTSDKIIVPKCPIKWTKDRLDFIHGLCKDNKTNYEIARLVYTKYKIHTSAQIIRTVKKQYIGV